MYFKLLFLLPLFTFSQGQIKFISLEYNLPPAIIGQTISLKVPFLNIGNEPIIITKCQSSNATSTISYSKKPILPNQTDTLIVKILNQKIGDFRHSFLVGINNQENVNILKINITVYETEIFGKVIDKKTREPLPYVSVRNKKNNIETRTDFDGYYSLKLNINDSLDISYPGMKSKNIIADKNEINIELEELELSVDLPYFPNRNSQKNEAHKMTINISEDKIIEQSKDTILTNKNFKLNEDFDFLIGNWKEIEFHGNNGANDYINKIENGQILSFEKDGTATLIKNNKKYEGKYVVLNHNKNYNKLQIITTDNEFYYLFATLEENKLTLTPVNSSYEFICKEGCVSIFEKVN